MIKVHPVKKRSHKKTKKQKFQTVEIVGKKTGGETP
jgi:hypothetical protein